MKKYNIAVNDLYGLVEDKLHMARLDRFHWKTEGYQLMANQSVKSIVRELNKSTSINTIDDCNVIWDSPSKKLVGVHAGDDGFWETLREKTLHLRQKKNKFWRQENRTLIDWFVAVPAKITKSGHQMELKLYEHHFYKVEWEELDKLIEAT